MSANGKDSETFQPVTGDLDLGTGYCDVRLLHQGSRACVYTAMRAGKRLILKAPADESGRLLQLLQREYEIAVNLSHPNTATIFTWDPETPVGPAIVMEYVDGVTLQQWLAENPSVAQRNRIFEQLLDAVEYIHKCGVVHNDLKPENLLVSRVSGELKLIDFGMADNDANVVERKLGGTRGYTAPELSDIGPSPDIRSDIYSLGVLMRDIFGRRYSRIVRQCTSPNIYYRYHNVGRLRKRWHLVRRLPGVLLSILVFLVLITVAIWCWYGYTQRLRQETESSLKQQSAQMQEQSQLLQDSIQMLSQTQKNATDSIGSLNAQLDNIKEQEVKRKTLSEEYQQGCKAVGQQLLRKAMKATTSEECFRIIGTLHAEIDNYSTSFAKKHGTIADDIVRRERFSAEDAQYQMLLKQTEKVRENLVVKEKEEREKRYNRDSKEVRR